MSVVPLADVKAALNITGTSSDVELQRLLDAAETYYAEIIGPVGTGLVADYTGTLPRYATNVVYKDAQGVVVDGDTFSYQGSPNLYWNAVHGAMGHGLYDQATWTITYDATIPAHHQLVIVNDVAELWTRTQRGGGTARPAFGGDGFTDLDAGRPLVLFPRIQALAGLTVA